MDYETIIKQFKELNAQIEAARATMSEAVKPLIEAATQQLFKSCPELESVFWHQYTPYFNDGESCEFSVHEPYFTLVGDVDYDSYEGSYLYTAEDLERAKTQLQDVTEYETDKEAWVAKKEAEYEQRTGQKYPYTNYNLLRPYQSLVSVQEEIAVIQASLAKYPPESVDRINKSFIVFANALSNIPEEIMRTVYGDHVRVSIDRSGTTVEDYYHD